MHHEPGLESIHPSVNARKTGHDVFLQRAADAAAPTSCLARLEAPWAWALGSREPAPLAGNDLTSTPKKTTHQNMPPKDETKHLAC